MWTTEYYVRYLPLPYDVGGAVVPNDDGSFQVYLNSNLGRSAQKRWLRHELAHIDLDHFYGEEDVEEIESAAHERERESETMEHGAHITKRRNEIMWQFSQEYGTI